MIHTIKAKIHEVIDGRVILSMTEEDYQNFQNLTKRPKYNIMEIVEYLNEKAGANYKPAAQNTQKLIKARVNEGFTLEDFKTVIDFKVSEWKGNPEMAKYLRPATLFSGKFDWYLNQADKPSDGVRRITKTYR